MTTAFLRAKYKRAFKLVDKYVAVVTDKQNRILRTYQSEKGNGEWKFTMRS